MGREKENEKTPSNKIYLHILYQMIYTSIYLSFVSFHKNVYHMRASNSLFLKKQIFPPI